MREEELLTRVRAGDAVAERALYEEHVDRVFRLAYRMSGDETLAQDIAQDTFIRAFDGIDGFRGESAFSTWLFAITNTVALNTLRKVKRLRAREADLDEGRTIAGSRGGAAEPDLKERLSEAVDALPEHYRIVFVMHDVEGFTHREIAEVLGMPVGTSKAKLSRARARLQKALGAFAEEWVS